MKCERCDKPLTGGVDTYGDPNGPVYCFVCWGVVQDEENELERQQENNW